jgi:hypothetical protein
MKKQTIPKGLRLKKYLIIKKFYNMKDDGTQEVLFQVRSGWVASKKGIPSKLLPKASSYLQ